MLTGTLKVGQATATVDSKVRHWESDNELLQRYLEITYPLQSSPSAGEFGAGQLREAAKDLQGTIEWGPLPPSVEGEVY